MKIAVYVFFSNCKMILFYALFSLKMADEKTDFVNNCSIAPKINNSFVVVQ